MAWTEERIKELKQLWSDGQSASKIAEQLGGVTRNAVIGKIHRLGLSNRVENTDKPALTKKRGRPAKSKNLNGRLKSVSEDKNKSLGASTLDNLGKYNTPSLEESENEVNSFNKEALENVAELEKNARRLNLMELTERTCKWPIGDPATENFWFCGHPSENGKPYCSTHISIAFQPISLKRERKAK